MESVKEGGEKPASFREKKKEANRQEKESRKDVQTLHSKEEESKNTRLEQKNRGTTCGQGDLTAKTKWILRSHKIGSSDDAT